MSNCGIGGFGEGETGAEMEGEGRWGALMMMMMMTERMGEDGEDADGAI